MYFRTKRSGGFEYLQVVESHRVDGKPRQSVVATLGQQERRDPGDVGLADVPSFQSELVYRCLDVGRVPKGDGVQRQAEGTELLLLFLAVGLPDFAAVAVADEQDQAF